MKKDEILNSSWLNYLEWWKNNINDAAKPPTEGGFWSWYAKYH